MAYTKQNFRNGNILDASELTHIEDGIIALEQNLNDALAEIPGSVEQATPVISVSSDGLITASAVQAAGVVSAGTKTATEQLPVQTAQTITPGVTDKTIKSGTYLTGAQTIKGDANLVGNNIRSGVSIFGVNGTLSPGSGVNVQSSKRVEPKKTSQTVVPDTNYDAFYSVIVDAIPDNYIDPSGTMNILNNGTHNITNYEFVNVNVPTGTTINAQEKTVTPTKSTQTVVPTDGHNALSSVIVKPIPSEYVVPSGTLSVSNNGTHNVTNYASVNVNVPSSGVTLPTLTNRGYESDLLSGKELIGPDGQIVMGRMADNGTITKVLDANTTSYTIPAGKHSGSGVVSIQTQSKLIYSNGTYYPDSGKVFDSITVDILTDAKLGSATEYSFGQVSITAVNGVSVSYTYADTFHVDAGEIILDNPTSQTVTIRPSGTSGSSFEFLKGKYFQKSGSTYYVPPDCNISRTGVSGVGGTVTAYKFVGTVYPVIVNAGTVMGTKNITENGTFYASDDGFDGFESVNVKVAYPGLARPAYDTHVLDGRQYIDENGDIMLGRMPNNGGDYVSLDTSKTRYAIPEGYHDGQGEVYITTETMTVTPKKSSQTVSASSGKVISSFTVNPIPSQYIEPSGTLDVYSNGTHNVSQYASVNVNVNSSASGVTLPTLSNRGYESDLLSGKELIGPDGQIVKGSMKNHGGVGGAIDGINMTSISGHAGYYSGVSVTFDSSAIEALINAI